MNQQALSNTRKKLRSMAISMHNISPSKGSKRPRKRVGRGLGSTGTYSGRGAKGQTARSGVSGLKRLGMKRWVLSQPKARGFKSFKRKVSVVNVGMLQKMFVASDHITPATLREKELITKNASSVKILGEGELTIALQISECKVSELAKTKIEAAGGKIN